MSDDITATVLRKTGGGPSGALSILVRASTFGEDQTVAVSRQQYDWLQPGMLVRMFRAGWGPTRRWHVRG